MASTFLDLVMDNGEMVKIECPEKYTDEMLESVENCMKRGDWWAPNQFAGCSATYMGMSLERVAMRRVVATL